MPYRPTQSPPWVRHSFGELEQRLCPTRKIVSADPYTSPLVYPAKDAGTIRLVPTKCSKANVADSGQHSARRPSRFSIGPLRVDTGHTPLLPPGPKAGPGSNHHLRFTVAHLLHARRYQIPAPRRASSLFDARLCLAEARDPGNRCRVQGILVRSSMDAKKLLKEAEDCRREAERASDPADKEFWLRIAAGWIELAKDAGKQRPS